MHKNKLKAHLRPLYIFVNWNILSKAKIIQYYYIFLFLKVIWTINIFFSYYYFFIY